MRGFILVETAVALSLFLIILLVHGGALMQSYKMLSEMRRLEQPAEIQCTEHPVLDEILLVYREKDLSEIRRLTVLSYAP